MASETASDLALPAQDESPGAARAERARVVSAELEEIFGRPPAEAERPIPHARARTPLEPGVRPRRRFSATTLGAVGAAALAGLAAGSLLVKPPPRHAAKPHPAALSVVMVPPQPLPQAADAALAEPAPPPAQLAVAPPLARVGPFPAAPLAHAVRQKARRHATSYADLLTADRRLRAAYAGAIRAGAPRPVILADRDRWASLRRRERDPMKLAAAYRNLAHHLDRAAAEARHREARNGRRSFFHPRFAPWWG
jgi:hypothetical protein